MDRRDVLVGGIALVVDATIPGTADATDLLADIIAYGDGNVFECSQPSVIKCSDDWRQWPEPRGSYAQGAVDRLLKRNPGARILRDTSFCMTPGYSRYPDPHPDGYYNAAYGKEPFYLVRQIQLDRVAVNADRG